MEERRTFNSPEEELDEALKALERTDIKTRELRKKLPDTKDEAALE